MTTTNRSIELLRNGVRLEMQRILSENRDEEVNLYKIIYHLRHSHRDFNEDDIDWNKFPVMLAEIKNKLELTFIAHLKTANIN